MSALPDEIVILASAEYGKHSYKWELIRDALDGETIIKGKNEKYLPMPSAMAMANAIAPSVQTGIGSADPDYHTNQPYSAYKSRARFPELTDATLRGIVGLVLRNLPSYAELPYVELEISATKDDKSLSELFVYLTSEVMSLGRVGVFLDLGDTGDLKVVSYATEDVLNWRTSGNSENIALQSVLLRDSTAQQEFWENDLGIEKHLLLILNDEGVFEIGQYEDGKLVGTVIPTYKGRALDFIPFVCIGTAELTPDIDTAPLWPLANVCKSIYQITADLRNAQFMSCNPMLTISGMDADSAPTAIGSSVALILEQYTAKAYYPKTDTTALEHVRFYLKDLQSEAVRLGANLLGNESTQAESGEAIRLRQSMSAATIASVVATVGAGLQRILNMLNLWMNQEPATKIKVNTEFSSFQLTANEQIALVQSWQAGLLSTDTSLENLRRAGMLQEGEDSKAELERIAQDAYKQQLDAQERKAEEPTKGIRGLNPDGTVNLPESSQANPAVS